MEFSTTPDTASDKFTPCHTLSLMTAALLGWPLHFCIRLIPAAGLQPWELIDPRKLKSVLVHMCVFPPPAPMPSPS